MSTDLNDQFVTRCKRCGKVITITGATAGGPFIDDCCRGCLAQQKELLRAAPKILGILAAVFLGIAFLFFGSIALMYFLSR